MQYSYFMKAAFPIKINCSLSKLYILCLYTLVTLINKEAYSQNLIANASLEDQNYCEEKVPCSPAAWYSVSIYPNGYENDFYRAYSGKRMIGFFVWTIEGVRTYWQTELLCPLQQGKMYQLSLYLYSPKLMFEECYFGAYFSEHLITSTADTVLQFADYLSITKENISADLKSRWLKVTLPFTATGKEKYLVLGNLSSQNSMEGVSHVSLKYVKYFIDNISLLPQDRNIRACSEYKYRKDSLYKANVRHSFPNENPTPLPAASASIDTTIATRSSFTDTLILGNINFDFDSYQLRNTNIISDYFNRINQNDIADIEVLGYTDSIGSRSYNNQLSQKRAQAVKNFLIDTYFFTNDQIIATGKGISNAQPNAALNRRVEVIIHKKR